MRGSPFLRIFIAVVLIVLCGIPVWHLTISSSASLPSISKTISSPETSAATQKFTFEFGASSAPEEVTLTLFGKSILNLHRPSTEFSQEVVLSLPSSGADVVLSVVWSPSAATSPHSLWVRVRQDGVTLLERGCWGRESALVTLPLPGVSPTPPHP